jgi:hypothetical protein
MPAREQQRHGVFERNANIDGKAVRLKCVRGFTLGIIGARRNQDAAGKIYRRRLPEVYLMIEHLFDSHRVGSASHVC